MDILDIDEALKDDSFIFLGEKTHDDVSNILQQWKHSTSASHNQGYKLNSRTFTRPKKKATESSEAKFTNYFYDNDNSAKIFDDHNIQMKIGGLVTTEQKSFLQDTSPPPSICSSIGIISDQINSSFITSSNFPKASECKNSFDMHNFISDSDKTEYLESTMQCSKKSVNSPTFSNESTYNKDLQIAQIDDISLALYKTESGCSTMNSSTESFELNNQNDEFLILKNVCEDFNEKLNVLDSESLNMENILDKTFNLKEIGASLNDDATKYITNNSVSRSEIISNLPSKEIWELKSKFPVTLENSKITFEKEDYVESTPKIYSKYLLKSSLNLNKVNVSPIVNVEKRKIKNLNETFDQELLSKSKFQTHIHSDFDAEVPDSNRKLQMDALTEDNQIVNAPNIIKNSTDQKLQKINVPETKSENHMGYELKVFKSDNSVGRLLNRRNRLYDDIDIDSLNKCHIENQNSVDNSENLKDSDTKYDNSSTNYKYNEKRERNRDRFKTIRIDKKCDEYNFNVPSNDNENATKSTEETVTSTEILLNCDKLSEVNILEKESLNTKSFLIEKNPNKNIVPPNKFENPIQTHAENLLVMEEKRTQFRSLSQPRQYKGIKKFDSKIIYKARSTTNLQKIHESSQHDNKKNNLKPPSNEETNSKNSYNYENTKNYKSKSVHNLSNNASQNYKPGTKQINSKVFEKNSIQNDRAIFKKPADEKGYVTSKFSLDTTITAKPERTLNSLIRPQIGYCSYNTKEKPVTQSIDNNCQRKKLICPKNMQSNTYDDNKVNQMQSLKETNPNSDSSKTKNLTGSLKTSASSKPSGLPRPKSIIRR